MQWDAGETKKMIEREAERTLTKIIRKEKLQRWKGWNQYLKENGLKRSRKKGKETSSWENSVSKGQEQEYSLNVIARSPSQKPKMAPNYPLNIYNS